MKIIASIGFRQILAVIAFSIFSTSCLSASDAPRWVDEKTDPALWSTARGILKDELVPDDPAKMGKYVANEYKYIYRIMRTNDFALVIIAEAMAKSYDRSIDYYKAYTVNLSSKSKSAIGEKGFSLWKFVKWANFDHSPISDTVFSFESCVECESTVLLASFQFDSKINQWKMRTWPEDGKLEPNVLIGDYWHGDDDDYYTTCMYSLNDFNNDGFSDIATYCRTKGESKGWQPAKAMLRTVTDAGPQTQKLEGAAAIELRQKLCKEHFEKKLCS